MSQREIADIEVQVHVRTSKALLVSDDGEKDGAVWLPLSQIEVEEKGRGRAVITAPVWLLTDKGLV